MTFELRKLNATDLFPMVNLISKIGLDEIASAFNADSLKGIAEMVKGEADDKGTAEYLAGINVVGKVANKILANIPKCDKEIYTLLANVSGKTVKEIKELDIDVFMEMIVAFVTKDEFKSFFKVAAQYIK